MNKKIHFSFFLIISALIFSLSGCKLFDKEEQIPSYLLVQSATVAPNYADYGSSSNKISDVWVYANDELIGCFELPARIPILAEGSTKITLLAGIKVNGISATRASYPFYASKSYQCDLSTDSATTINPIFDFDVSSVITFNEDFESAGIIFQKVDLYSDTTIEATNNISDVFRNDQDPTEISNYSGVINLDSENDTCQIETISGYALPKNGTYTFLEFNYKCSTPVEVGIKAYTSSTMTRHQMIVLNSTDTWKKMYVNLTARVSGEINALNFKIYFACILRSGATQDKVLLDNIKLIHANTAK